MFTQLLNDKIIKNSFVTNTKPLICNNSRSIFTTHTYTQTVTFQATPDIENKTHWKKDSPWKMANKKAIDHHSVRKHYTQLTRPVAKILPSRKSDNNSLRSNDERKTLQYNLIIMFCPYLTPRKLWNPQQ